MGSGGSGGEQWGAVGVLVSNGAYMVYSSLVCVVCIKGVIYNIEKIAHD